MYGTRTFVLPLAIDIDRVVSPSATGRNPISSRLFVLLFATFLCFLPASEFLRKGKATAPKIRFEYTQTAAMSFYYLAKLLVLVFFLVFSSRGISLSLYSRRIQGGWLAG